MEREVERLREQEPIQQAPNLEEIIQSINADRQNLAKKPHVLKNDRVPWVQNMMTTAKHWMRVSHFTEPTNTWTAPIYSMTVHEQVVPPGNCSGRHRHYMEALFYVMEGRGHEIHDEKEYHWESGDLMCVPTNCTHQHFTEPDSPLSHFFFVVPRVYYNIGLGNVEQIQVQSRYKPTQEGLALLGSGQELTLQLANRTRSSKFDGKVTTIYDSYLKQLRDEVEWRLSCAHVVKGSARPWEDTRMGRLKWLAHPSIPSGLLALDCYLQELLPGGHSGRHRHVAEEVHKILKGRGYDIHDGVRWDWDTGDAVFIPSHTVHQHFNADLEQTALFVSVQSRVYSFVGHGGIEHLEDSPRL